MIVSLLTHDFSVRYVAENNATTTPPFISVISLWAALEGSILFWTLLATGWATLVLYRYRERHRHLMPWVGAVLATINAFFFAVMTWPGNPFALTSPAGTEGAGPNALLQNHPFMALHPPLLYLGYTGMAIPFAFGIAALATRRLDEEWLRIVRRWTLIPWTFLTLGIVAGAWWSYEVLGWGGYWAWDPVENAALLPWLTATAFVHSAMVAERRGGLRIWTSALVIATFVLTLVGTFLTRSGVVASVHSFTQSAIGPWFLGGILVALAGSLTLLVWRLPELVGGDRPSGTVSRESAFLLNNVLFLGLTFAVLFGTLLPLLVAATSGDTISVGAPWFTTVTVPIFVALLFLMGVGPALPWGTASWATIARTVHAAPRSRRGRDRCRTRARAPRLGTARHAWPGGLRRRDHGRGSRARSPRTRPRPRRGSRHRNLAPDDAQPAPIRRLRGAPRHPGHGGIGRGLVRAGVGSHGDPGSRRDGDHRRLPGPSRPPRGRSAGQRRAGHRDARRGHLLGAHRTARSTPRCATTRTRRRPSQRRPSAPRWRRTSTSRCWPPTPERAR